MSIFFNKYSIKTITVLLIVFYCQLAVAQTVSFAAVGDIFFGRAGRNYGTDDPFTYVKKIFKTKDIVLGNLETPIASTRQRVLDKPCSLKKNTCKTAKDRRYRRLYLLTFNGRLTAPAILKTAGFTLLATANNHAGDQGSSAILETKNNLQKAGLVAVGSGNTPENAFKPVIINKKGIKIGVIAATVVINFQSKGNGGYYAYATFEKMITLLPAKVKELKSKTDFIIVTLHYSMEGSQRASHGEQKLMRRLAKAGADLFIGTHPHVLGGIQIIGKMLVIYTLGNFLFDRSQDLWGKSAILHLDFIKNDKKTYMDNIFLSPVVLKGAPCGLPKPATDYEAKTILKMIKKLSAVYKNPCGTIVIKNDRLNINI